MDLPIVKYKKLRPEKVLRLCIGFILCIVLASGISFYCFDINLMNFIANLSLCPFHTITGTQCPGCGMSRAFLLLGQLKIKEALIMNVFSLALFFYMGLYFIMGRIPDWLKKKYLVYISLPLVIMFWILRIINF